MMHKSLMAFVFLSVVCVGWTVACSPESDDADLQRYSNREADDLKRWAKTWREIERQLRPNIDFFCKVVPGATDFDGAVARYNEAERARLAVKQRDLKVRFAVAIASDPGLESFLQSARAQGLLATNLASQWLVDHGPRLEKLGRIFREASESAGVKNGGNAMAWVLDKSDRTRAFAAFLRDVVANRAAIGSAAVRIESMGKLATAAGPWLSVLSKTSWLLARFFVAYDVALKSCDVSNVLLAALQNEAAQSDLRAVNARMRSIDPVYCCAMRQRNGSWPSPEVADCSAVRNNVPKCASFSPASR